MVDYYQCTAWKLIITTLCWRYKHGLLVLAFGIDVQTHRQKRFSSNNTIKECWFAFVKITISISCSFNTSPHICAWEVKYFFLQIVLVCGHILLFQKALFYYFPNDTLTMLHTPCIVNALDCLTVRKCSIGGVTIVRPIYWDISMIVVMLFTPHAWGQKFTWNNSMEHLLDLFKFFPEAFEGQGSQLSPFFHHFHHLIDGIKTAFDCMKVWCKHVNIESLIIP